MFETAGRVWDDPLHVTVPDRIEEGEQRWHAIGVVGGITVLVVVHVYRGTEDKVRFIGLARLQAMNGDIMSTTLGPEELDALRRLATMDDQAIDTADIPEAPGENWRRARRPSVLAARLAPTLEDLLDTIGRMEERYAAAPGQQAEELWSAYQQVSERFEADLENPRDRLLSKGAALMMIKALLAGKNAAS